MSEERCLNKIVLLHIWRCVHKNNHSAKNICKGTSTVVFFISLCSYYYYHLSPRKIVIKIGKKKKRKPESSEEESDDDPPPRHSSKDVDSVSMHAALLSSKVRNWCHFCIDIVEVEKHRQCENHMDCTWLDVLYLFSQITQKLMKVVFQHPVIV